MRVSSSAECVPLLQALSYAAACNAISGCAQAGAPSLVTEPQSIFCFTTGRTMSVGANRVTLKLGSGRATWLLVSSPARAGYMHDMFRL